MTSGGRKPTGGNEEEEAVLSVKSCAASMGIQSKASAARNKWERFGMCAGRECTCRGIYLSDVISQEPSSGF